jgi:hypothetical protein
MLVFMFIRQLKHLKGISPILFLPIALLAQDSNRHLAGKYEGWWADSYWTYIFDRNNSYQFKTAGHFGITKTIGHFLISEDTIFLTPFSTDQQEDRNYMSNVDTLLMDGDTCVISLAVGCDYRKVKHNNTNIYISRQRIKSKEALRTKRIDGRQQVGLCKRGESKYH